MPTTLTICFDPPYWIALIEMIEDDQLYVAQQLFGAEPSDAEVLDFVLRHAAEVMARRSPGVPVESAERRPVNPKRQQREIRRQLEEHGISSKAQEALRLQIELNKQTRHVVNKAARADELAYKRERKIEKRKARHRGH